MSSTAILKNLNFEIKLPNEDTHYLQVHSSSTVCTLKHKIFRKSSSLEGEKMENYVLAVKYQAQVCPLPEEKQITSSHPFIEEEHLKERLITLYLMPKQDGAQHHRIRRKDSSGRLSIYDENRLLLPPRNFSTPQKSPSNSPVQNPFGMIIGGGEERSFFVIRKEKEDNTITASNSSSLSSNSSLEKPCLVRSKSEPILRTTRSASNLNLSIDMTEEISSESLESESYSDEDDSGIHGDIDSFTGGGGSTKKAKEERHISLPSTVLTTMKSTLEKEEKQRPKSDKPVKKSKEEKEKDKEKDPSKKKTGLFSLRPKKEKEDKEKDKEKEKDKTSKDTEKDKPVVEGKDLLAVPKKDKRRSLQFAEDSHLAVAGGHSPPPLGRSAGDDKNLTFLRKVPVDYSAKKSNSALFVEEDGDKLVVTAGTVEELINCLADRDIPDPSYLDEFFYSMTYFTTGTVVVNNLRGRFDYPPPADSSPEVVAEHDKWREIVQKRVLHVFRYMLENHWYHFERDATLFPLIKEFIEASFSQNSSQRIANGYRGLREMVTLRDATGSVGRRLSAGFSLPPPIPLLFGPTPPTSPTASSSPGSSPPTPSPSPITTGSTDLGAHGKSNSADLGSHGRSSSSPIIAWRNRGETVTASASMSRITASSVSPPPPILEEIPSSTPSSLTAVVPGASLPPVPKILGRKFKDYKKVSFMRVHPLELARQLTLVERDLFRSIYPPEVAGGAWKKKTKSDVAPNVVRMIEWFNHITGWVQMEVVMTPNLKERILVLGRFVQVAGYLRDMGNLNGAMEVVSALNTVNVKRLQKTWRGLQRKDSTMFVALEEDFSAEGNYNNYRKILATMPNGLPYIGVVLQDLLMIEEIPTFLPNGMVNFRKMRRFASVLRAEILERQSVLRRFNFEAINVVQEYLVRTAPLTDQDLYRYSRLCEPSNTV